MIMRDLFEDDAGFVVSAELVLVSTILVIGMMTGLSEVQHAVVQELNDVADAMGELNQSYSYSGFSKRKGRFGLRPSAITRGSRFIDQQDDCDRNQCDLACDLARPERPKRR